MGAAAFHAKSQLNHPLPSRARVAFIGKTGMGKSTAAKAAAAAELRAGARVVAFDPHDEWSVHGDDRGGEVTLGPLRDRLTTDQLLDNPYLLDDPHLSLAVVPQRDATPAELAEDFCELAEAVKATGNLTFIVDEVGEFQKHCQATLDRVGTGYRKYKVAVILCAQRAVQISKTCRTQLSEMVCFLQDDPEDLSALEHRTRYSVPDFADRVSRLGRGQSVQWRDASFTNTKEKTP
jgi:energy-coupling factor transporter ATP-binding protein EcfA2